MGKFLEWLKINEADQTNLWADAMEEVLKTWKGTPEELGATLEDATSTVSNERKRVARARILACVGGKKLLGLEQKSQKRL